MTIGIGTGIVLPYGSTAFSPATLFASNEVGAWYDPSDLSTLFQDSAGTTAVTTAGQSVGLVLDKSKGLSLGPELVTNGDFSGGSTGWGVVGTATFNSGACQIDASSTVFRNGVTVAGNWYVMTFDVVSVTNLGATAYIGGPALSVTTTGRKQFIGLATGTQIAWQTAAASTIVIDNVSVRLLPGNHASQSTAASRPTYGTVPATGRRNLLTYSQEFDNAAWAKSSVTITPNDLIAPDGTLTADRVTASATGLADALSRGFTSASGETYSFSVYLKQGNTAYSEIGIVDQGVQSKAVRLTYATGVATVSVGTCTAAAVSVGNGWFRVTITTTIPTGGVDSIHVYPLASVGSTSGDYCYVWGAQLELGSTATAYQRVGSAFDITEAGVQTLHYLSFDGSDDFLQTGTITPGTDKAQVFAGVRKLSDAAIGVVAETGTSVFVDNGSFLLSAPRSAAANYGFSSRGTVSVDATTPASYASPVSSVVVGLGDISGDSTISRVNGVVATNATSDQGTGNYLAYPLYIGRRAGTSLPFNGNLYGLITRFSSANLDSGLLQTTERWMGNKTGVSW